MSQVYFLYLSLLMNEKYIYVILTINNIQGSKKRKAWLDNDVKVKLCQALASHDVFQGVTILYTLKEINHIIIELYQIYGVFRSVILIFNIKKLTKTQLF